MSNTFLRSEPEQETTQTSEITDGAVDPNTSTPEASDDQLPSEATATPSVPEKFLKEDGSVDLEKLTESYKALEAKQGAAEGDESTEEVDETEDDDTAAEDRKAQEEQVKSIVDEAGFTMDDLQTQVETNGDLSDEVYAKFAEMGYPEEMARMYVRGLKASAATATELRDSTYEMAGGEDSYQAMIEWAADNLTDAEIDAYDDAVNSLNKARTVKAVQTLMAKYEMHADKEPETTVNGDSNTTSEGYADEAEYMADLMDPRYDTVEAYRNKVIAKRMKSNF